MSRKARCSLFFRPAGEALEDRLALAGNVSAVLKGATLEIKGDDAANQIRITQTSPQQLKLEGLATTTINGSPIPTALFNLMGARPGTLFSLKVTMNGGNDSVTLGQGPIVTLKDLTVDTGAGADVLYLNHLEVKGTGTHHIRLGADKEVDNDYMDWVASAQIAGSLDVKTGGGDDTFKINNLTVLKNLTVDLGDGNDYAKVHPDSFITGDTKFSLGDGSNTLNTEVIHAAKSMQIYGGSGVDTVLMEDGVETNRLTIKLYEGNDALTVRAVAKSFTAPVSASTYATSVVIDLGTGNDNMSSKYVYAQNVQLSLGDGTNSVTLDLYDVVGLTTIKGGVNNDSLTVTNSTFARVGGAFSDGDDTITTIAGLRVVINSSIVLSGGKGTNKAIDNGLTLPTNPQSRRITDFTIV